MAVNPEVLGKIRKCLVLGEKGTPNEAAVAMQKARELMLKYQVDMADLQLVDAEKTSVKKEDVDLGVPKGQPINWRRILLNHIASFADCKMLYYSGRPSAVLVGRPDDIQLATELYIYCTTELERMANAKYDAMWEQGVRTGSNRKNWRVDFCTSAANELWYVLTELKKATEVDMGEKVTALVVRKADDNDAFVKKTWGRVSTSTLSADIWGDMARKAGQQAAHNLNIANRGKRLED